MTSLKSVSNQLEVRIQVIHSIQPCVLIKQLQRFTQTMLVLRLGVHVAHANLKLTPQLGMTLNS